MKHQGCDLEPTILRRDVPDRSILTLIRDLGCFPLNKSREILLFAFYELELTCQLPLELSLTEPEQ